MSAAALLLVEVLRVPERVAGLDAEGWTALLAAARAEQLIASLAHRLEGQPVPDAAAAILADARRSAEQGRVQALWEAEMARRALAPLGIPAILLKGTAFAAAQLQAGEGRFIGDLDILVPRSSLDQGEVALLDAGWEWVKDDLYDSHYYRQWMHELPPLIHRERDRMIDVHHTILPPTARPKPDAAALIEESIALPNGLRTLSPPDMIIHAAAHLFADGDLAGGLRNLWDIDRLLRQFGSDADFWPRLAEHTQRHDLEGAVSRALRLSNRLYGTPLKHETRHPGLVPGSTGTQGAVQEAQWMPEQVRHDRGLILADRLFVRRLLARDGWGRTTRKLTRFAFYVRSHWIRMPPLMLARHLLIKARRN
jgi:hypothetical protein